MIVMGETLAVPCSTVPAPPHAGAPAGTIDCHMHVFDPRFADVEGRNPPPGTPEDYRLFQRRMGLERCIVVAASSYGLDNSCLPAALGRLGDKARGIASIDPSFTDDRLEALPLAGCRGIRFNHGRVRGTTVDGIRRLADRIAPLNGVFQLNMPDPADGLVGVDPNSGARRFTLGLPELADGVEFIAIAMAFFVFAEVIKNPASPERRDVFTARVTGLMPSCADLREASPAIARGPALGSVLGVLPGGGAILSTWAPYAVEKRLSRHPERFGKGRSAAWRARRRPTTPPCRPR